ncbi:MAG: hypothetical protein M1828_000149 [Chrysothrix sp. TS-e1954]|nr:MAG: hypothetical protein M1828_000149 [Chrysothrix sp. TS-e1954]
MPIKFPKTFRRSSQNALDTIENPPEQSFRVLPRPQDSTTSFDGGDRLTRPRRARPKSSTLQHQRPQSYGIDSDSSNRGSGNTYTSHSTGGAIANHRMSYGSTVPSSVDSDHDLPPPEMPYARQNTEPAYVPMPGSRSAFSTLPGNRSMSFGQQNSDIDKATPAPSTTQSHRQRADTESSEASTATPFQLDVGSSLGWDYANSGFGNALGDISSNDQPQQMPKRRSSPLRQDLPDYGPKSRGKQPATPQRNGDADSLKENEAPRRDSFGPSEDASVVMDAVYASRALEQEHSPALSTAPLVDRTMRQSPYDSPRQSGANSGFMGTMSNSIAASNLRKMPRPHSPSPNGLFGTPEADGSSTSKARAVEEPLFRPPVAATNLRPKSRSPGPMGAQNKVMTPAEFEEYKRRKAVARVLDDAKSDASSESDTYEDEDETERQKQNMRQRRKQEAHLSVYRQQMMKVTGEQPSDLSSAQPRRVLERSAQSEPNFLASLSFDTKPKEKGKKNSDDEDEDVPLGVLQAHGFPHKSRPPTRMTMSSGPRPQSRMSSYPQPMGATRNEAAAGGGGNLPAFARKLPTDPYVGAGVVQNASRESLPFGAQAQMAPGVPPGGLVGVIVGEERARAMRRTNPNAQGSYGPTRPSADQTQAQAQMQEQMQQMMQMQMQWMQQMQQMQQMMQMMPPGTQMPQMPQMPGMPQPTPSLFGNSTFLQPPGQQSSAASFHPAQRAPSMMSHALPNGTGPSLSAQSMYGMPQQQYAPSIAPSERSNVGQPSRYRPVSTAPTTDPSRSNKQSRTSTMSAATVQGLNVPSKSRSQSQLRKPLKSTIKAVDKPKRGVGAASDEEDEEGWAEMRKKREQRQTRWRGARGRSATRLDGAAPQFEGMEGLYYEG